MNRRFRASLLVSALLTATPLLADTPFSISVALGGSIPRADFADDDIENDDAGFATNGVGAEILVEYRLMDTVSAVVGYGFTANALDGRALLDEFRTTAGPASWSVDGVLYSLHRFPIGLMFRDQATRTFGFQACVGLGYLHMPEFTVSARSLTTFDLISETVAAMVYRGYLWSLGVRKEFPWTEVHGAFFVSLGISQWTPFESEEAFSTGEINGIPVVTSRYAYEAPVQTVELMIGLKMGQ